MLRVNAYVLADYISLVGNLLQNQIKLNHQRKPVPVIPLRSTCNWTVFEERPSWSGVSTGYETEDLTSRHIYLRNARKPRPCK